MNKPPSTLVNVLVVTACFWMAPVMAADAGYRIEITPLFGYVTGGTFKDKFANTDLEIADSVAAGLQFNIRADYQTTWEFLYAKQESETLSPGLLPVDVSIEKLEIGGTYEMSEEATRLYAAATLGASRFEPQNSAFNGDTYFSFSLGGGARFFADRQVGITLDARWIGAFIDGDTDVFCLSDGGLTCLIQTDAGLASQFRVFVGLNARF